MSSDSRIQSITATGQSDVTDGSDPVVLSRLTDELVTVKTIELNSGDVGQQNEEHWKKLIELRDDHLAHYLQSYIKDNTRFLVIDTCQGSLLDYCNERLDESIVGHIGAIDIMWQTTCGLEFLHRQQIVHGALGLDNVLFWKNSSKSKRVVVKLAGYGHNHLTSADDFDNDIQALPALFHAAAAKISSKPITPVISSDLIEIKSHCRALAANLINLLSKKNFKPEVNLILRHPLFVQCVEEARYKLRDYLVTMSHVNWNKQSLNKWKETLLDESNTFDDEEFEDFQDILLSETNNKIQKIDEAFKITPKYFSEYMWYFSTEGTQSGSTLSSKREEIGKGAYGKVFKDLYTDDKGNTFVAAFKKCSGRKGAETILDKEIKTLKQLNHPYIVKLIDVIETNSKKWVVMELCEGTLRAYVEGNLPRIPKESLHIKTIVSQMVRGMVYIHDHNIIHKDLKPDNILLWCDPSDCEIVRAKIADFGFAKELKPNQLEFSHTKHPGTDSYMAPELLNVGNGIYPASFASDVYSLGLTIGYFALNGIHPYSSQTIVKQLLMVKGMIPPSLQNLNWDLQVLIVSMTDNDPENRPTMNLVLRHPYFVLTSEQTKRRFVDQVFQFMASLSPVQRASKMKKMLNGNHFLEWYHYTLSRNMHIFRNMDGQEIEEIKKMLTEIANDVDNFFPAEAYDEKIQEGFKNESNRGITGAVENGGFKLLEATSSCSTAANKLLTLLRRFPKTVSLYVWSQLDSLFDANETKGRFGVKLDPKKSGLTMKTRRRMQRIAQIRNSRSSSTM